MGHTAVFFRPGERLRLQRLGAVTAAWGLGFNPSQIGEWLLIYGGE